MTPNHRVIVGALVLLAILSGLLLVGYAAVSCPSSTSSSPCPDAPMHRTVVIALAAATTVFLATPFAFLAEVVTRRRIVYRGAWGRATRRGLLAAALVAVIAGLRLGGALSIPVVIFLFVIAGLVEWFALRRTGRPLRPGRGA